MMLIGRAVGALSRSIGMGVILAGLAAPPVSLAADPEDVVPVILRITVQANGRIQLDGRRTNLRQLDAVLADAERDNTVVWYYRENGHLDPPPEALQVVQLIIKYQLPVTLLTDPDFPDLAGEIGLGQAR